jgi:cytoskeletal protein CcmA (bactofilin family)
MATKIDNMNYPITSDEIVGVLGSEAEFDGLLSFSGKLVINGILRGRVLSPDTLVIGEGANAHCDIEVGVLIVSGNLTGKVTARHRVELKKTAIFKGEMTTPSLLIEEGAVFDGTNRMYTTQSFETDLE